LEVLVDSNVILDVLTDDPARFKWSSESLALEADRNTLVINPIIYAEISMRFASIEDPEEVFDPLFFRKDPRPRPLTLNGERTTNPSFTLYIGKRISFLALSSNIFFFSTSQISIRSMASMVCLVTRPPS
jgi:hypothetical protein